MSQNCNHGVILPRPPAEPIGLFRSHTSDSAIAMKRTYATLVRAMSSWNHWRRTIHGLHGPEGLQPPQGPKKQVATQSFQRLCRYYTLYKTPIIPHGNRMMLSYALAINAVRQHWLWLPVSIGSSSPLFENPDLMNSVGRATWRGELSCCPPLSPTPATTSPDDPCPCKIISLRFSCGPC